MNEITQDESVPLQTEGCGSLSYQTTAFLLPPPALVCFSRLGKFHLIELNVIIKNLNKVVLVKVLRKNRLLMLNDGYLTQNLTDCT